MDQLLYTIRWDDGTTTKLYYEEFVSLGPFETIDSFQSAICGSATGAKLTLGPNGGFRGFKISVYHDGVAIIAQYGLRDGSIYRKFIEPCLQRAGIAPELIQIERKSTIRKIT